jgi:GxxExxY protein
MAQEDQKFRRTDPVSNQVIGACIEVHRALGPGLLESAYEECLCRELSLRGLSFERQVPLAIEYKGANVDCAYRLDLVVCNSVVLELKSIEHLLPIHLAQVLTYLKLSGHPIGLLVNFNVAALRQGLRRLTLRF